MNRLLRILVFLLLALAGGGAFAQSCTITTATPLASGSNYDPFTLTDNKTQGAFSIACTRTKNSTKFPATFYVGANNGLYYSSTRRLLHGTSDYLSYGLFMDYPGCSQNWGSTTLTEVYSLPNANTQGSQTTTSPDPLTSGKAFCFKITGGVNTAVPGTYSDTVQVAVGDSPTSVWGSVGVTLTTTVSPACSFTTAPTPITLNYTSFSASSISGNSPFQLRCTNTTTYTLAFDTASGTILGLSYRLTLNNASGTGTGLPQGYTSTATLPAGQAGTCSGASCTATMTRSVVVSY